MVLGMVPSHSEFCSLWKNVLDCQFPELWGTSGCAQNNHYTVKECWGWHMQMRK